jgi:hypothetical protein
MYENAGMSFTSTLPGATPVTVLHDDGSDDLEYAAAWASISDAERAFARELVLAVLAEDLAAEAVAAANGWDPLPCFDLEVPTADEVVESLTGPATEMDLPLLVSVDPAALDSDLTRVAYLQRLDKVAAFVAAKRAEVLVAIAGAESSGAYLSEVAVENDVAVARRTSRYAAGKAIEVARSLTTTFPSFADALLAGDISERHCNVLVDKTRAVADPEVLAAIEMRVLRKAKRLPVGKFGQEVAKAVVELDPDTVARHRRAKETARGVYSRPLEDGLGFLGVVDEWGVISALQATIDADAQVLRQQRGGAAAIAEDDDARLGACRADALAARVLGQVDADGTVTWHPRDSISVTLDLVMDLDTLRGEQDRLALLDGQPVPAEIAREHADTITAWRRAVTDPVDGHLLDYGTHQHLPEKLRRFVMARDGECIAPDCATRSPRRLQLDHVIPFPQGPSSISNTDTKCTVCHQLKTAGHVHVDDTRADGSRAWVTALGQTVRIPARPYLHDPTDDPPPRRPSARQAPESPPASRPSTLPHPETPPF